MNSPLNPPLSRRRFLGHTSRTAVGAAALAQFPFVLTSPAAPDDQPINIGVIGCGGRGTGAVLDALGAATKVIYPSTGYHTEEVDRAAALKNRNLQVLALADAFPDRLASCRQQLARLEITLPDEHCFLGFDGYEKLLALPDINYVILATPPHFRPAQLMAAIRAGKHVFMEKPAAVDGPGVRLVMEAGRLAREKGLGIVAGTQRRHQLDYQETIRRIHEGAIGDLQYAEAYWNGGVIWVIERQPGWSDMEWQTRNWNYFTWLGGDHIVEQHVHNLDVINWALGDHPVKASGMGGRQARPGKTYGHIYDHFATVYEYSSGLKLFSQCRQMQGCEGKVEETLHGTRGSTNLRNWIRSPAGNWRFRGDQPNPYQQEHQDLMAGIRGGTPANEAQAIAESTLTGIMGREAAYTGQSITWEQALNSQTRLGPREYVLGELPFPEVAVPGRYVFT